MNGFRMLLAAVALAAGGLGIDDAVNERYKDVTPREFFAVTVALLLGTASSKRKRGRDDDDDESS